MNAETPTKFSTPVVVEKCSRYIAAYVTQSQFDAMRLAANAKCGGNQSAFIKQAVTNTARRVLGRRRS